MSIWLILTIVFGGLFVITLGAVIYIARHLADLFKGFM